jgi:hypothetical protein
MALNWWENDLETVAKALAPALISALEPVLVAKFNELEAELVAKLEALIAKI